MEEQMPKSEVKRTRKIPRFLLVILVAIGTLTFVITFVVCFANSYDYQHNSGTETVEELDARLGELYAEYDKVREEFLAANTNDPNSEAMQIYNSKVANLTNEINDLNIKRKMKTEGYEREKNSYQLGKFYQPATFAFLFMLATIIAAFVIYRKQTL